MNRSTIIYLILLVGIVFGLPLWVATDIGKQQPSYTLTWGNVFVGFLSMAVPSILAYLIGKNYNR